MTRLCILCSNFKLFHIIVFTVTLLCNNLSFADEVVQGNVTQNLQNQAQQLQVENNDSNIKEQVIITRKDVELYLQKNSKKQQVSNLAEDLSTDLSGLDLSGLDFTGMQAFGVKFDNCKLKTPYLRTHIWRNLALKV